MAQGNIVLGLQMQVTGQDQLSGAASALKEVNAAATAANGSEGLGGLTSTFSNMQGPLAHLGFHSFAADLGETGVAGRALTGVFAGLGEAIGPLGIALGLAAGAYEIFNKYQESVSKSNEQNIKQTADIITINTALKKSIKDLEDSGLTHEQALRKLNVTQNQVNETNALALTQGIRDSDNRKVALGEYADLASAIQRVDQEQIKWEQTKNTPNADRSKLNAAESELKQVREDLAATSISAKDLEENLKLIGSSSSVIQALRDIDTGIKEENSSLSASTKAFSIYFTDLKSGFKGSSADFNEAKQDLSNYFNSIKDDTENTFNELQKAAGGSAKWHFLYTGLSDARVDVEQTLRDLNDSTDNDLGKLYNIIQSDMNRIPGAVDLITNQINSIYKAAGTTKLNTEEQTQVKLLQSQRKGLQDRLNTEKEFDNKLSQQQDTAQRIVEGSTDKLASNVESTYKTMGQNIVQYGGAAWSTLGEESLIAIQQAGAQEIEALAQIAEKDLAIQAAKMFGLGNIGGALLALGEATAIGAIAGVAGGLLSGAASYNQSSIDNGLQGNGSTSANTAGANGSTAGANSQYNFYINSTGSIDPGTAQHIINAINTQVQNNGGYLSSTSIFAGSNPVSVA